ncbi:hypothetical protein ISCGN_001088 [Ixodes scapularis]
MTRKGKVTRRPCRRRSLSRSAWPVLRDVRVPLSRHGCGEKDVPKTTPGQSAMKHALLLLLLAIGFREQPVAHQAPAQQTRPGCNYAYWSYYPAYTVGGFQYQPQSGYYQPQSGHYQPQSGYYQPQSGHYQPQSGYYQPQSGYYQPQSGYYQPQSGYYQPQSGYYPPHGYSYEYQHRQHQQHGTYGYAAHYPSVLPYPYPLPLPPPPPLPPHSPGPWIPGPSHPPVPPPPPAPKNVDPFPGKFLGMGSVRYVNGARDVELICNLQGDKIVSVRTLIR